MDTPPTPLEDRTRSSWEAGGLRTFAEIAAVMLAVPVFGYLGVLLLGFDFSERVLGSELLLVKCIEVPLSLLALAALLWSRGERFSDLGWRFPPAQTGADLRRGLIAVLPLLLLAAGVSAVLKSFDLETHLPFVLDSTGEVLALMTAGILAGGISEEILFRGFIFRRLERSFAPNSKRGTVLAALTTSLAFAMLHAYEGPAAVGAIFVVAAGLQVLYLNSGRRLLAPMVCHAMFNLVQIGLLASASS
jgi:membrane protease YdiL (CAAX protease family)